MRKLQQTKSNLESEKFNQLKDFEMEKLEMLKKIEELLSLNDILVGSKRIYDDYGNSLDTLEVMSILSPAEDAYRSEGSSKLTIRSIISKLKEKFIPTNEQGVQAKEIKSKGFIAVI